MTSKGLGANTPSVLWERNLPWRNHWPDMLDSSPVVQPWEWEPRTAVVGGRVSFISFPLNVLDLKFN